MKYIMSILLLSVSMLSFAGDIQFQQQRPDTLKVQVDLMRQEVPQRFACMINEIKEAHPGDKSTQLYVLKMNVKAYWNVREADYPTAYIISALEDHPCDFATVEYVVKLQVKSDSSLDDLLK